MTSSTPLSPDQEVELMISVQEAQKIINTPRDPIKNEQTLGEAIAQLKVVKATLKNITAKKESLIRPLQQPIKFIREFFQQPEVQLLELEKELKQSILAYQELVQKRAEKSAKKISDDVAAGKLDLPGAMNKMGKIKQLDGTVSTEAGTVQFRNIRKVRITDPMLVPAQYHLDAGVIQALQTAVYTDAMAGLPIPGVAVIEEQILAA